MARRSSVIAMVLAACGQDPAGEPPPPAEPAAVLAEPALRRLTVSQYRQTLRDLFGDDFVLPTSLEPDESLDGLLSIGATAKAISPRGVEQYESAAAQVLDQVLGPGPGRDALVPCAPVGAVDEVCAGRVLDTLGRRIWRRTLQAEERARLLDLADQAASELGDFYEGLELALGAMLQSPNFLYRVELGEADPDDSGRRRFTDWEMASRLSYFLWASTPDDALLDAAARGELTTDEGLRAQVERLLADPRARVGFRSYVDELLTLYELDDLLKDPMVFPAMRADLGPSAREETLAGVEALVFDRDDDFRSWLTTPYTYVNPTLAMIYAVAAPDLAGFGPVSLPADGLRRGLLGQASVLTLHAHPVSTSATRRGMFIREVLLCQSVPPPPADVDTSIPEPRPGALTLRDRVKVHQENPACSGCHLFTDPMGLALENFDGIGVYRTTENGAPIDPSGDLDGDAFADLRGLAQVLSEDARFSACMTESLYAYAAGHRPGEGEEAVVAWLHDRFAEDGFSMYELLRHVVLSDAFRHAGEVLP